MAFKVVRSEQAKDDLANLYDYLVDSYLSFGTSIEEAVTRTNLRLRETSLTLERLAEFPYRGTVINELGVTIRRFTRNKVIYYFDLDTEDNTVRILSIFFGGQDHETYMHKRFSGETE